ncbi:hypothetical protein F4556_006797 [Kitasatospora gansuensis]|uniref:Uncharacterized protein n=1 Tax=Kitasatospora gansuensis TaxID=258050 RepID=A0A7W7SJG8_9ACTN|nr:hypothetical protein [Kitasatospora gansuensis]MBB4951262.1 hypothetical protein [Kitasatospora gansuensis]
MLVAAPHRTGGQAQFIDLPVRPEPSVAPTLYDWAQVATMLRCR